MVITPIQIRFNDLDMFAHVNNSIYSQYFDLGRLQYLNQIFGQLNDWEGKTLVVVHIESDYLQPTFLHDTVHVQTQIVSVGNRSIKMFQQLVDDKGDVRVKSSSVMSAFDKRTNLSFTIPDEWRKAIVEHEEAGAI